jgi:hypothetical protein
LFTEEAHSGVMELNLVLAMMMLWLAASLTVAVVVGRAVRLRDRGPAFPSVAERPEEVLHLTV